MAFPIDRRGDRTFEPGWTGHIFVVDIDRTYLATRFSRLRDLARIPFERAEEKQDIEGMARLLRELRYGPGPASRETPLYFVSASPKQLRATIERKLALDGIGFDGTTFKDWVSAIRQRRIRGFRQQLGFKLTALLANREALPTGAAELLLGDDLESDPLAYALYADALAGRIPASDLVRVLRSNHVRDADADDIATRCRTMAPGRGVVQAFIRLERHTDPDAFIEYAPSVLGCTNALQMAAALWKHEAVSLPAIVHVALALQERGVDVTVLGRELADLVRRAIVSEDEATAIHTALVEAGLDLASAAWPPADARWLATHATARDRPWTPARFLG